MRFSITQILAGLGAAVAFCFAFMAAGVLLVSTLFMLAGLAAVGWLAFSLIRQGRRRANGA